MANEIKILVRTQNSAKAGFDAVNKDVDDFAKKSANSFTERFSTTLTQGIRTNVVNRLEALPAQAQASAHSAGRDLGDTIGQAASMTMSDRLAEGLRRDLGGRLRDSRGRFVSGGGGGQNTRVSVDVDRNGFLRSIARLATEAGSLITGIFGKSIGSVFSGDALSVAIKVGLLTSATATLAPAIGGIVSSGVLLALGGGAIGAGIAGAFKDPRIKQEAKSLVEDIKKMFSRFSENFESPVSNFLGGAAKLLKQLEPLIDSLGEKLGPVADKLGEGILGMLDKLLPAIIRGMEAAIPVVETLAEMLPELGEDVAFFFDEISKSAPDAAIFFKDLIDFVGWLIRVFGSLIRITTEWYVDIRNFVRSVIRFFGNLGDAGRAAWNWVSTGVNRVRTMLGAVRSFVNSARSLLANTLAAAGRAAWNWVSGVGSRLGRALAAVRNFVNRVRDLLRNIPRNIVVNIVPNFLNGVRNFLGFAHGGVVGRAAEGGPRSGLTWVGEHGPELVRLAPGSQVSTAGDSRRMAAGAGGTFVGRLSVDRSQAGSRELVDMLMKLLRVEIFRMAGGNVQQALGTGASR